MRRTNGVVWWWCLSMENPSRLGFQKHVCMLWRQAEAVVIACSEQQNHAPMPPLLYSTLPLNTLLRGNGLSLALVFLVAVVVVVVVLSAGRESCMAEKENGVVAMACMVKKEEFTLEKD